MSRLAAALLAGLVLAVVPASAQAAFTLSGPSAKPADARAGANSDFNVRVAVGGGQLKDLVLHLPPGLVGDPFATPKCTRAQFDGNACPDGTQLGRTTTNATVLGAPQAIPGKIYNLVTSGAEAARLGIVLRPSVGSPIRLESIATIRAPGDNGLDSTLKDLPNKFQGLDITITSLDITLFGQAGQPAKPFMTNPTGCAPAETVFDAVAYSGEKAQAKASFTPTACDALPYAPQLEAVLGARGETGNSGHPPLTTIVTQGAGEANSRRVAVTLPTDISVGFSGLNRACPEATFLAGGCPEGAKIGSASATVPLLPAPLTGPVWFIVPEGSPLPALVAQLRGPLALDVRGTTTFAKEGGLVTTFDGLPDVPLSRFALQFNGGAATGILELTRDVCVGKAPRLSASYLSHGGVEKPATVAARVDGCRPEGTVRLGALRGRRPNLRVRVDAGPSRVKKVVVTLPKALRFTGRAGRLARVFGQKGAKLRTTARTATLTATGDGPRSLSVQFRRGALRVVRGRRLGSRPAFTVAATSANGDLRRLSVRPAPAG